MSAQAPAECAHLAVKQPGYMSSVASGLHAGAHLPARRTVLDGLQIAPVNGDRMTRMRTCPDRDRRGFVHVGDVGRIARLHVHRGQTHKASLCRH